MFDFAISDLSIRLEQRRVPMRKRFVTLLFRRVHSSSFKSWRNSIAKPDADDARRFACIPSFRPLPLLP